jgi:aldose 1-epimerase
MSVDKMGAESLPDGLMRVSTTVVQAPFGLLKDGSVVEAYTLTNSEVELQLITFGARVVTLKTKDRQGVSGDIALGYNSLDEYVNKKNTYFGVVAGRYANRIAKGHLELEGRVYETALNNLGVNTLHGGTDGFDRRNWMAKEIPDGVCFTLVSPDGDQGFPGTLKIQVKYTLHGNMVRIEYRATTDQTTVINLTNHTYFNLSGEGSGSIVGEQLQINADNFTPVDQWLIPTGEMPSVEGTPFDFREESAIGERLDLDGEQLKICSGFDHNWVLCREPGALRTAARLFDPASGRVLLIETTEPGLQFNSGQYFDGTLVGKSGRPYGKHCALALETQHFPDSPNHPSFPTTELRPGQLFQSVTTWTLTALP